MVHAHCDSLSREMRDAADVCFVVIMCVCWPLRLQESGHARVDGATCVVVIKLHYSTGCGR